MKQIKQMYETPKVEFIEMETQGILCSSAEMETQGILCSSADIDWTGGTVMNLDRTGDGAWVL